MIAPAAPPASAVSWRSDALLAAVAAAVLAFYAWTVAPSRIDWGNIENRGAYYNQLVDGFAAGQLNLKVDIPPELAALPDPYDPEANAMVRIGRHLHDTSYFNGKLYLYYGVTPALVLFGPYHAITGDYLYNRDAALVFCALSFFASALLVRAIWRRYFASVHVLAVGAALVTVGLASGAPLLLRTPAICELVIACGQAFAFCAALALWTALHRPQRRLRWLIAASVCYGLAIGARPSLLFGGFALLVPVVAVWREADSARRRRDVVRALAAALVPIACIGIGLAWYNDARFGSIFEFGQRYQLAGDRQDAAQHFSASYLAYNWRCYFFAVAPGHGRFPFLELVTLPAAPSGHAPPEGAYGLFSCTPVLLCFAATAWAWRQTTAFGLRAILGTLAWWFVSATLLLGCFYGTVMRYEYEFAPALAALAAIGVLALEQHVRSSRWRLAWRLGWIATLAYSAAFVVLLNVRMLADEWNVQGVLLAGEGRNAEAVERFSRALRVKPDLLHARRNRAQVQLGMGDSAAAVGSFQAWLELEPDSLEANNKLGLAYLAVGRPEDAVAQFRIAARLEPTAAIPHLNLGVTLLRLGRPAEAVPHLEIAWRAAPDTPGLRTTLEAARRQAATR